MSSVVTSSGATAVLLGLLALPLPGSADTETARHMGAQHDAMKAIQAAIIAGSLDAAREPASRLLEQGAPAAGEPANAGYVEAVRLAASDVLAADTLESAAEAASQLGLACGACHTANSATVEFAEVRRPSDKEKERPHMQRHQWAADRMWEGLIGPSDDAWSAGVAALASIDVDTADIGTPEAVQPKVEYLLTRIGELGVLGGELGSSQERSAVYGEFLSLCADCHSWTGGGPGVR